MAFAAGGVFVCFEGAKEIVGGFELRVIDGSAD
jgi:predicted DNA repair protein MutK